MSQTQQPKALKVLFLTELWERYGYYAAQSILVLFMQHYLGYGDSLSYSLFGTFGALIFITPILGGYIADRWFGYRHTILLGGILLSLGYFTVALGGEPNFYWGLSLLICGNGLFKPNISSLLGNFYFDDDPRRETGFTLFYMGINIGGTIGVLLNGFITHQVGWLAGFISAGTGLLFALLVFNLGVEQIGMDLVKQRDYPFDLKKLIIVYGGIAMLTSICFVALHYPVIVGILFDLLAIVIFTALLIYAFRCPVDERNRLLAAIILIVFSIVFWVLYQQGPMSLTLFIARDVDRHIFGHEIPASSFWSLNGIFIILFTPFIIKFWRWLNKHNLEPSTPTKFAIGIFLIAAGYILLYLSTKQATESGLISYWWIVISYALQVLGELALSPIGLAMITQLAPKRIAAMMMGIWFFASAIAMELAGTVAKLASIPQDLNDKITIAHIYGKAFISYGYWALAVGVVLFLSVPFIKRLMLTK